MEELTSLVSESIEASKTALVVIDLQQGIVLSPKQGDAYKCSGG